jgi:hypothetical protein
LATACERWMVIHASCWRFCSSGGSAGFQPIEQQVGAGQRHQPRALRVPLVPAHEHAEAANACVDRRETEVARGEVELLVVPGIVRDVHLAVPARHAAVAVEHHGGVVVQPEGAALEQRAHQHDLQLARERGEPLARGPGDRLGQVEELGVLVLAEIDAGVQLLQQHQPGTTLRGLADAGFAGRKVLLAVLAAALLHEAGFEDFAHSVAAMGRSYNGVAAMGRCCNGVAAVGRSYNGVAAMGRSCGGIAAMGRSCGGVAALGRS